MRNTRDIPTVLRVYVNQVFLTGKGDVHIVDILFTLDEMMTRSMITVVHIPPLQGAQTCSSDATVNNRNEQ